MAHYNLLRLESCVPAELRAHHHHHHHQHVYTPLPEGTGANRTSAQTLSDYTRDNVAGGCRGNKEIFLHPVSLVVVVVVVVVWCSGPDNYLQQKSET